MTKYSLSTIKFSKVAKLSRGNRSYYQGIVAASHIAILLFWMVNNTY